MASTGAVIYWRGRTAASTAAGRSTGAVVQLSSRVATGIFTNVGVVPSRDLQNLRSFLPHSRQAVLSPDGSMNNAWYRFFQTFVDVFLGGAGAYTLQDIINTVTVTQEQITAQAAAGVGVSQQSQANAEALAATVQVMQDNSIPGYEQIPPVALHQTTE